MTPISSAVTAGTNATAAEVNNIRTDAIGRVRVYVFDIRGTLGVSNEQGPKYIIPYAATVIAIKHKITSGTSATIRVQKDTDDVDASIAVGTSVATETAITSAALAANQILTLDVTGIDAAIDLLVEVITTETI